MELLLKGKGQNYGCSSESRDYFKHTYINLWVSLITSSERTHTGAEAEGDGLDKVEYVADLNEGIPLCLCPNSQSHFSFPLSAYK